MDANNTLNQTDVEQAIAVAAAWRKTQPDNLRNAGVALVFRGAVYGWKNALRDPQHDQPDAMAVAVDGQVWIACGGDEYNGAEAWRPISDAGGDV